MRNFRDPRSVQEMIYESHLAHAWLRHAENNVEAARHQVGMADRTLKDAELVARCAKSRIKRARNELDEAKAQLVRIESKLAATRAREATYLTSSKTKASHVIRVKEHE